MSNSTLSDSELSDLHEAQLVDRNTTRTYYRQYMRDGLDKLLHTKHAGSTTGFLSVSEAGGLDENLQENLHLTTKSVAAYIKKRRHIGFRERGVTALLHRLGCVYKKPQLILGNADVKDQQLREDKQPDNLSLFMDGVHPQHISVMACGKIKSGIEFKIQSNTEHQRLNIHSMVNIDSLETVCSFFNPINEESTISLYQAIEERYPKAGTLYVICDNTRYCRSKAIRQFLETSKELVFLPPFAPNPNLTKKKSYMTRIMNPLKNSKKHSRISFLSQKSMLPICAYF